MRVSRRQLAAGAMVAAVLAGEVAGRWLVANLPFFDQVPRRAQGGPDAWPALVVAAEVAVALLLARLGWRAVRALRVAAAGERMVRLRQHAAARPTPTIGLSPRAWLASFTAMAVLYVVPTSMAEASAGPWPLVAALWQTQALPVFAVLAAVVAVLWRTVSGWLAALERYGELLGSVIRSARAAVCAVRRRGRCADGAPRSRFGVAFQCRPPPAASA